MGSKAFKLFIDVDWVGSIIDQSKHLASVHLFGKIRLHGGEKKQNVVDSSAKVEYKAMAQGVCGILRLKKILEDLQLLMTLPMKLYCDNKDAISISQNPIQNTRTKHVETTDIL